MKRLYHGSIENFNRIDIAKGRGYKDFGKGFYATAVRQHAERIALRNKQRKLERYMVRGVDTTILAYVYTLDFENSNLSYLNIKVFDKPNLEWVRFILYNRKSAITSHNYDIVIGPTADKNTNIIIDDFIESLGGRKPSNEQLYSLIRKLEPNNLPKQYFFATQRAVSKLKIRRQEIIL